MKYILIIAGMFTLCSCHTSKTARSNNSADTLVRIITWGLPNFSIAAEESQLAAKWGFYYDYAASCIVSNEEIDSFNTYNKTAERPIVQKHGKNWRKRFYRELSTITASPERCDIFFNYNNEVYLKRKELALTGDTLFYHFLPTKRVGVYNVEIVGWNRQNTKKEWVSFFRYHVDYRTGKLKQTRKSIKSDPSFTSGNIYYLTN